MSVTVCVAIDMAQTLSAGCIRLPRVSWGLACIQTYCGAAGLVVVDTEPDTEPVLKMLTACCAWPRLPFRDISSMIEAGWVRKECDMGRKCNCVDTTVKHDDDLVVWPSE